MPARPAVPVTAEDYAQLIDCACRQFRSQLPDVHPAGVCAQLRAASTTTGARPGGASR